MRQLKIAALGVLALLVLVVVLQNTGPVEARFLFFAFTAPVAVLLFVVGAIGFLLGVAVSLFTGRKRREPPAT